MDPFDAAEGLPVPRPTRHAAGTASGLYQKNQPAVHALPVGVRVGTEEATA
jgi:hypothetical protein